MPSLPRAFVAVLAIVAAVLPPRGNVSAAGGAAQAEQWLARARQAIGGVEAVGGVHTLTAAGRFRRDLGDMEAEGEFSLALQPPDKLVRTETVRLRRGVMTRTLGVNGTRLLRSTPRHVGGTSADPFPLPRGAPRVASEEDLEQGLIRVQRAELDRLLLLWLAIPPSDGRLALAYGGRAESPDGTAEVIEIKGPEEVWARLFLDARTHRPLLLAHSGVRAAGRRPSPVSGAAAPSLEEVRVYVEDHRTVGPLLLPHHVSVSAGATTLEEWHIDTFRINPPLEAGTFEPVP